MKKIRRNEIEIINKEYFLEYYKQIDEENKMKSLEEEIIYVKHLIKKTNNKIKNLQKNCYLTYDDILSDNNNNQNIILIKANGNTKPNIEIIEDDKVDNIDENFDINFNLNLNNEKNNYVNKNKNVNYDVLNISNQSSSNFINSIKNDNPLELFLISPKIK